MKMVLDGDGVGVKKTTKVCWKGFAGVVSAT